MVQISSSKACRDGEVSASTAVAGCLGPGLCRERRLLVGFVMGSLGRRSFKLLLSLALLK